MLEYCAADGAAPAAPARLHQFHPAFYAADFKYGADFRAFEFGMRVIGPARAGLHGIEEASAKIKLSAHVEAVTAQADGDGFFALFLFGLFAAFFFAV